MTAIVIDTSAIFSILLLEADCDQIAARMAASKRRSISAATLFEAFCAVRRPNLIAFRDKLPPLIDHLDLTVVAFDQQQLEIAQTAYAKFGRGSRHAAGLNMGDCFSYALSKVLDQPLLFKGSDFIHTDVKSAI